MVLCKLPAPGRPTIWMKVKHGPIALAVGADEGLFGHFYYPLSFLSSISFSLGDGPMWTVRLSQMAANTRTTETTFYGDHTVSITSCSEKGYPLEARIT